MKDLSALAQSVEKTEAMPLCPIHAELDRKGKLDVEIGNNCIGCSLHERTALLELLATKVPEGELPDSVDFLRHVLSSYQPQAAEGQQGVSPARFTDEELEYIYLQTDCDADHEMFLRIEKKCRQQIARYREFDAEAAKAASLA
jgi:hypothetical protein